MARISRKTGEKTEETAVGAVAGSPPHVVIVGRPNVGKSTLFNRLCGSRRAIVDRVPGSTRDRNAALAEWSGRTFEVVDTGGIANGSGDEMVALIEAQVAAALAGASIVCWVVDGASGILPGDLELARRLRPVASRVVLAVNKVDDPKRAALGLEFHSLGFEPVYPISAEHGLGVAELLDEISKRLPAARGRAQMAHETRLALVGRPNVGKSSLLNALVGEKRVLVSEVAGTTRDAVDTRLFRGPRSYLVVDTAGIRRRGKTPRRVDRLAVLVAERAIERAHVALLVVDAAAGLTREDAAIAGKIAAAGRAAVLVFNKWDLLDEREQAAKALAREAERRLSHLDYAPLAFVSALTGRGVSRLLPLVDRVREQHTRRLPTPELNRAVSRMVRSHPGRTRDGREIKVYYSIQDGTGPPHFTLFSSVDRHIDPGYVRSLARQLREQFGFSGTPVRVTLRKKP
jgi:GTP-binding protein